LAAGPEDFPLVSDKKEYCGLFGVFGDPEAVQKVYLGLFSLQHRGQESAGIASTDGQTIQHHVGMGLVREVFTPADLKRLSNPAAIGHVRYSTTGSSRVENAQPMLAQYSRGQVAVAHNGNLTNAKLLRDEFEAYGSIFRTTNDTEIILHLLARPSGGALADPFAAVLDQLEGAYSLLLLTPTEMIAACDPYKFRPLSLGRLGNAWCVSSETCAFDLLGIEFVRDVQAGEIIHISAEGVSSSIYCHPERLKPSHCIFEHIYFSRPDSHIFGDSVHAVRRNLGRQLAREHPVDADVVFAVPDTGNSASIGYAYESGIPFDIGFIRSHYVGRTFIQPHQNDRDSSVKVKLAIMHEVVKGKRLIVVEDSVVRGTTTRGKMRALREAGAREIHLRVSSPPVRNPCFYGIDFPTSDELLASGRTPHEIAQFLGVDSIGYLSVPGLLSCVSRPPADYCGACFTGRYPVPVGVHVGKYAMERHQLSMF
jgi:amidophosphoribosyltransferase